MADTAAFGVAILGGNEFLHPGGALRLATSRGFPSRLELEKTNLAINFVHSKIIQVLIACPPFSVAVCKICIAVLGSHRRATVHDAADARAIGWGNEARRCLTYVSDCMRPWLARSRNVGADTEVLGLPSDRKVAAIRHDEAWHCATMGCMHALPRFAEEWPLTGIKASRKLLELWCPRLLVVLGSDKIGRRGLILHAA